MARRDAFPLPGKHPKLPAIILNDANARNRQEAQTPAIIPAMRRANNVTQPAFTVKLTCTRYKPTRSKAKMEIDHDDE